MLVLSSKERPGLGRTLFQRLGNLNIRKGRKYLFLKGATERTNFLVLPFKPPEMVRGKRVLVTGSSTGFGEQIAYEFARMGAHLLLTARREKQLKEVAQKCLELGASSARHVVSYMNNLTSAQNVIEEARNKLGGLDYLVLNHVGGSGQFGPFQGDMAAVTSSMTVNFLSYVQLTVSAMTMLQESQGSITVISSLSGKEGTPFSLSYSAAKFALEGFYSSLRRELRLREISLSVTVAVLGYIDTGKTKMSYILTGA
uniref:Uncharacterized protein n=1 Tax=Chelonoidis abingdonii TaxID=106734 RepID=A0A8C0HDR5_CHEAB